MIVPAGAPPPSRPQEWSYNLEFASMAAFTDAVDAAFEQR